MSDQIFRHQHRVTYAECTIGDHVYYGRYLNILEEARGEFFRSLDESFLKWQELDALFPVIECRLRYKAAARYDDMLTIEVWLTELERVRLNFAYRIVNEGGVKILLASTLHACTTLEKELRRLPDELVRKLKPFLRTVADKA